MICILDTLLRSTTITLVDTPRYERFAPLAVKLARKSPYTPVNTCRLLLWLQFYGLPVLPPDERAWCNNYLESVFGRDGTDVMAGVQTCDKTCVFGRYLPTVVPDIDGLAIQKWYEVGKKELLSLFELDTVDDCGYWTDDHVGFIAVGFGFSFDGC